VLIREATPGDIPGIARVHVDTWRTTYPGIVPAEHLAQLSYERSKARWRDHLAGMAGRRFAYVAEDAGRIIGLTSGGPERDGLPGYDGELYGLYLLADYQRRGIGRALTLTVARRLVAEGFKAMVIWVLRNNLNARAFYEALGGVLIHEKPITIGSAELVDVAYGWPDLSTMLLEKG
jgi:ribosomal protein S18 acetylase RimI-like enzyme